MSTLRTFNLQNPDSGTVNIEMDQGGNTLMTGIATVRGAAHFTSTSGSDAVGIGTDITAYKLDVRVTGAEAGLRVYNPDTSSNASGILRLGNDDNQNAAFLRLNGSNNTSAVGGAGSLVLGHGLSKNLHLSTAGASRFAVRSDGKISAGTLLDTNNSYEFSIRGADGTGCLYAHGRNHYLSTRSTSHSSLTLKKSNSDSDGVDYLQLRDSSNAAKLIINGDGTLQIVDSIKHMGDTDTLISFPANDTITLHTSGSERFRINSIGNIGMSNDMTGAGGAYARLTVQMPTQSGGSGIQVANSSNGSGDGTTSNIVLRSVNNDCSQWAGAEYRASDHIFAIQGTEKIRINSDGRLLINATNNPTIGGQTPYLRVNGGYANLDGLRIRGLDTGNTIWKTGGDMGITVGSAHSLKLNTNSATGLQINANGYVTKPLQPRFFARRSANYTGYDGRNVGGTWIAFDVVDYNVGSGFQTSGSDQGRFVAPVSGLYLFHAATYKNTGTGDWSQSWFDIDGSRANGTDFVHSSSTRFAQNAIQVYLTAGQKIGFHPYNNQTNNPIIQTATHTWFKGCLLS